MRIYHDGASPRHFKGHLPISCLFGRPLWVAVAGSVLHLLYMNTGSRAIIATVVGIVVGFYFYHLTSGSGLTLREFQQATGLAPAIAIVGAVLGFGAAWLVLWIPNIWRESLAETENSTPSQAAPAGPDA